VKFLGVGFAILATWEWKCAAALWSIHQFKVPTLASGALKLWCDSIALEFDRGVGRYFQIAATSRATTTHADKQTFHEVGNHLNHLFIGLRTFVSLDLRHTATALPHASIARLACTAVYLNEVLA